MSAYAIGIGLSFVLNRRFTFRSDVKGLMTFTIFAAIAIVGMLSTWLLSLVLRYGLDLDVLLGDASAGAAFATAAFLSSALTYPLSALLVFRERQPG